MNDEKNVETKTITSIVGQTINVNLQSMSGSTGYTWQISSLSGINLVSAEIIPGSMIVPTNYIFNFFAVKTGTGKVEFNLIAPWRPEEPAQTIIYEIVIKEKEKTPSEDIESAMKNTGFTSSNINNPYMPYGFPADFANAQILKYGIPTVKYGISCIQQKDIPDQSWVYYGIPCVQSSQANNNIPDPRVYYGFPCVQSSQANNNIPDPRVYYGFPCTQSAQADNNIPDPSWVYYGFPCTQNTQANNIKPNPWVYYGFPPYGFPPYGFPLYGMPPIKGFC
jgi:hypothetical protein